MPMFAPMDSMILWTMRKRKKTRRSEDFLVYNDWLCIEYNNFFWIPEHRPCVRCWTSPIFTSLHQKNLKLHEASLHENIMRSYTSRKLHFTSFNEDMG
jgi:hypothetical protein